MLHSSNLFSQVYVFHIHLHILKYCGVENSLFNFEVSSVSWDIIKLMQPVESTRRWTEESHATETIFL